MKQTVQQTQKRGRGAGYIFAHSLYITKAWNWFLEFMGRAAEAVLVISVLYASVKLLPVVHMPAGLDVVIFIAQFVALDVGGLSLGKLAKQAQAEGNHDGAIQASRMSKALIIVMIVGVVVVAIEQLFPIPANWKLGIDTVLLIARSILAVLYGHIIHTLRKEDLFADDEQTQPEQGKFQGLLSWSIMGMAAHLQSEYQQLAGNQAKEIRDLYSHFADQLGEIKTEQGVMLAGIDQVRNAVPVIDYEELTQIILTRLETEFDARQKAQVEIRQQDLTPQIDAPRPRQKRASPSKNDASSKILTLRQPNASKTEKKEVIHRLLDKDQSLSSYRLATLANCSEPTARRIKNEYLENCSDALPGAIDASNCDASEQIVLTHDVARHDA